jgi:uncharacterized repeat protein (TIGR01451 family)
MTNLTKKLFFTAVYFVLISNYTAGQEIVHFKQFGNAQISHHITDLEHCTYLYGSIMGANAARNPVSGTNYLVPGPAGSNFIAKLSANGQLMWVKIVPRDIVKFYLSDANELIFVADFSNSNNSRSSFDYNPGSGVWIPNIVMPNAKVIVKLSSNGVFLKGFSIEHTRALVINDLKWKATGDLFLCGSYVSSVDFDLEFGSSLKVNPSSTYSTGYLVKYNPDGRLDYVRAFEYASRSRPPHLSYINNLDFDSAGNIFLAGCAYGLVDLDPGPEEHYSDSYTSLLGFVVKLDRNGNFVNAGEHGIGAAETSYFFNIKVFPDGSFLICSKNEADNDVTFDNSFIDVIDATDAQRFKFISYVAMFDNNFNYLWHYAGGSMNRFQHPSFLVLANGDILLQNNIIEDWDVNPSPIEEQRSSGNMVIHISSDGKYKGHFVPPYFSRISFSSSLNESRIVTSYNLGNAPYDVDSRPGIEYETLLSGDNTGVLIAFSINSISGNVMNIDAKTCDSPNFNRPVSGVNLRLMPMNKIIQTNALGTYSLPMLGVGTYSIEVDTTGPWKPSCESKVTFTILSEDNGFVVPSILVYNEGPCIEPAVDIYTPFFRRCFDNNQVLVSVQNKYGALDTIQQGVLKVMLDEHLSITSAIPANYIERNDSILFMVPDLVPGESFIVKINTRTSCDALWSDVICNYAELFPQSECLEEKNNSANFGGDSNVVSITSKCINNNIIFYLRGISLVDGARGDFKNYVLYKDDIKFKSDSIFITPGQTDSIMLQGDGHTWKLSVEQNSRFNNGDFAHSIITGCGPIEYGVAKSPQQIYLPNHTNIYASHCSEVRGSFDPNDKSATPSGISERNFVVPNIWMDYLIRFQNTGNDTAFTVVIVDTISESLNLSSFQEGFSSHNYVIEFLDDRVVKWTFYDIMLPDSTTNLQGSNGFIKFRIKQVNDLNDGTLISNSASIYFDFNEPIFTNSASVTVNRNVDEKYVFDQVNKQMTGCSEVVYNGNKFLSNGLHSVFDPNELVWIKLDVKVDECSFTQGESSIYLVPNPANGSVIVNISSTNANVEFSGMYNSNGTKVDCNYSRISNNLYELNFSVSSGIYVINFFVNGEITSAKFLQE